MSSRPCDECGDFEAEYGDNLAVYCEECWAAAHDGEEIVGDVAEGDEA